MRILLAGARADRDRLRARLPSSFVVLGEYDSEPEARAAGLDAEAILTAPASHAAPPAREAPDTRREETHARPSAATHAPPPADDDGPDVEALTPREVQVLELLAEGLPNRAIAARLGISDQTVKFHLASIMGKLGTSNRVETVRRAVRRGLIVL